MPATRDGKTWRCQFYYEDWQGVRHKKNKRGFKTKENVVWLTQWRLVYTDCRRQKSSRQGAKPDLSGCIFDGDSS